MVIQTNGGFVEMEFCVQPHTLPARKELGDIIFSVSFFSIEAFPIEALGIWLMSINLSSPNFPELLLRFGKGTEIL